jgi:hypothetical protein
LLSLALPQLAPPNYLSRISRTLLPLLQRPTPIGSRPVGPAPTSPAPSIFLACTQVSIAEASWTLVPKRPAQGSFPLGTFQLVAPRGGRKTGSPPIN